MSRLLTSTLRSVARNCSASFKQQQLPSVSGIQLLRLSYPPSHAQPNMGLASSSTKFVEEQIKSDCVVIFSKTTCGFCRMAKSAFDDLGVPFTAIEVNLRDDGAEIQEALAEITGGTTVPRVFVNAKCIGGGSETRELQRQGRLLDLVKQCQQNNVKANL